MGKVLYRSEEYASCCEILDQAIASKDEVEPIELLFLAMALERMGDHERAAIRFRKADEKGT